MKFLGTYDPQYIVCLIDGEEVIGFSDESIIDLRYGSRPVIRIFLQHVSPSLKLFNNRPDFVKLLIPNGDDTSVLSVSANIVDITKYMYHETNEVGYITIDLEVSLPKIEVINKENK